LSAPYFSKTFVLECDASGDGLGVVLMQDNHPITFESQKFKPREKTKSTYDKEMLAIMHALVKWKQYLLGMKFLVKTDHNSLKYFLTQKNLSSEQQKWVRKIQVFDFDILYKKGKENLVVDGLSRKLDNDATLCAISIIILEWISEVQTEYIKNPEMRRLIEEVERNPTANPKFTWENDILWYKQQIFFPNSSKFKLQVLKENHDSPSAGHVGFFKTYYNICQSFFWKGM
jgi:hypothetical protein